VEFTGLAQTLDRFCNSDRDFQPNCWANLIILVQPCEYQVLGMVGHSRSDGRPASNCFWGGCRCWRGRPADAAAADRAKARNARNGPWITRAACRRLTCRAAALNRDLAIAAPAAASLSKKTDRGAPARRAGAPAAAPPAAPRRGCAAPRRARNQALSHCPARMRERNNRCTPRHHLHLDPGARARVLLGVLRRRGARLAQRGRRRLGGALLDLPCNNDESDDSREQFEVFVVEMV
jgi:hypothetical protein